MNAPHTLIQEAQNLHHQLALVSSAVIGHLETYASHAGDVYTDVIFEQMTKSTQSAGRIAEQLRSLNSLNNPVPEAGVNPPLVADCAAGIDEELEDVIGIVKAYESLGLENSSPTITGNEVSILMGVISDKLNSIRALFRETRGSALA
ncbi:MAG: hypothetical protein Q7U57_08105 [Methylovulum sp.]|nr:hypothetical protein [Methylovulum sp.]